MHRKSHNLSPSIESDAPVLDTIVNDINSICDDPIGRTLEMRKPKKYPTVWIRSLSRPALLETKDLYFLPLFTKVEGATKGLFTFCKAHKWAPNDVEIRTFTFVEAFALLSEIPSPIQLADSSYIDQIAGVCIEGTRTSRTYPA